MILHCATAQFRSAVLCGCAQGPSV